MPTREYVDASGRFPVYVSGPFYVTLQNAPLSISLPDARTLANAIIQGKVSPYVRVNPTPADFPPDLPLA